MSRRHFRPGLWPTAMTLPSLLILLALGGWQVVRLEEKRVLIAEREAALAAPPIELAAGSAIDPRVEAGRRVEVSGVFDHANELYFAVRTLKGMPGTDVLTPLVRDDGVVVLVNRGWIAASAKDPARRSAGQIAGIVTIVGLAAEPGLRGAFTPENDVAANQWYWYDLKAMGTSTGHRLAPLVLLAGPAANPGGLPVGRAFAVELANNHLQYAITWFALALALLTIYLIYSLRHEDDAA